MKVSEIQKSRNRDLLLRYIVLIGGGTVVNLLGSLLTDTLYLDSAGTFACILVGGYIPGMLASALTFLILGIFDTTNLYFSAIGLMGAITLGMLSKKLFKPYSARPLIAVPILAVVMGVPRAVFLWFVHLRSLTGADPVSIWLHQTKGLPDFPSMLLGTLILSFFDCLLSVVISTAVFWIVPANVSRSFRSVSVWQNPLPSGIEKTIREKKTRSVSIRIRLLACLSISALLIMLTASAISSVLYRKTLEAEHMTIAENLADSVASVIDGDNVNAYIAQGRAHPDYNEIEEKLYWLRGSNAEVEFIYVYQIRKDGCYAVFDLDTEEFPGAEPGDFVPFEEGFEPYIDDLLAGHEIPALVTDDSYGWLLTIYKPVYDSSGICRCYACVDISMNDLHDYRRNFAVRLLILVIVMFVLTLTVSLWIVEQSIVLPINTMAYATGAFAYDSDKAREENVKRIRELGIRTGDEIENLYHAIAKTTQDSMDNIADIQYKNETISQMQNGLIMVLADMVESRDQNTGDHIKKTAAYVEVITDEMRKRGFYQEEMTDEFIRSVISAAPLHDVGKIHISDTILNKPGKLTDEEFRTMQKHTLYGSEIIDRAIKMVPEPGYLAVAKELAEYHHEKWNGKGYPHGLKGETIPLSARIMAVADVFDALVSRRSYKEPFSFEKAIGIIREDAGSHFDPLVAEAFLGAEERVRKIVNDHSDE